MNRPAGAAFFAVGLWLLLLAAGNLCAEPEATLKQAIIGLSGDMRSSNPGVRRDANSDNVLVNVVEALMAFDDSLNVKPMLAESVSVDTDGRRYRFKLRQGVRFHNGQELKAKDLKYNWDKILNPATKFQCLNFFDGSLGVKVVSVNALSAYILELELEKKSSIFLEMLASIQCPVAALHRDSWAADGSWLKPIATGPFKFDTWKKSSHIILSKFDRYQSRTEPSSGLSGEKKVWLDKIKFQVIADVMARNSALISGQIDIAPTLSPISTLVLRRNRGVAVSQSDGANRRALIFQTQNKMMADINLRRAIDLAIDKNLMAEITSFGFSRANGSLVLRASPLYSDVHEVGRPVNVEKAKKLLALSGYQGQTVRILSSKTYPVLFDIAMVAESMLKRVGIKTEVVVLEWSAFINRYFSGDFELMAFEYSPRLSAHMSYVTAIGNAQVYPYLWGHDKANSLMKAAASELDIEKRKQLYEQLHLIMVDQVPAINLYNPRVNDAVTPRLSGYSAWPGAKPRLWGVRLTAPR